MKCGDREYYHDLCYNTGVRSNPEECFLNLIHEAVAARLPSALMGPSRLKRQGETQDCSAGLDDVSRVFFVVVGLVFVLFCFA